MDIQGFSVGGGLTALNNSLQNHELGQELIQKTLNESQSAANAQTAPQAAQPAQAEAGAANAAGQGTMVDKMV